MPIADYRVIVVALPHEAQAVLPHLKTQSMTRYQQAKIYEGLLASRPTLLLQTGIGGPAAEAAMEFLLNYFPVDRVLVTGYCGGLSADLPTGAAILADKIFFRTRDALVTTGQRWGEEVFRRLQSQGIPIHRGHLVQVEKPALTPEAKKKLGETFGALGVDMETFSVLKIAQRRENIASLALRFIVDPLGVDLMDTEAFVDSTGNVQGMPFVKAMLRRPKMLFRLPGLERMASQARRSLEASLKVIFEL